MATNGAAILRDHRRTPALYPDDEGFGSYSAGVARASRKGWATGAAPKAASRAGATQNYHAQVPVTDELGERPASKIPVRAGKNSPIPLRRRSITVSDNGHQLVAISRRIQWKTLFWMSIIPTLYTIIFLVAYLGIAVGNSLSYGPTHTSYTEAVLNGEPATIIASVTEKGVYITLIQTRSDGATQASTYQGPQLDADTWGDDIQGIVATTKVTTTTKGQAVVVTLMGEVNYWHLFDTTPDFAISRPKMQFWLVSSGADYKVVS